MLEQERTVESLELLSKSSAGGGGGGGSGVTNAHSGTKLEGHAAACRAFKASRLLSLTGQHGLQFATGLVMLRLYPSSLLLVSLAGLLESWALLVSGGAVGSKVDSLSKLGSARAMHLLQNSMGAVSAAAMLAMLHTPGADGSRLWRWGGLALALGAGAANRVGAFGLTCVERQWAAALGGGDTCSLAALNSALKCIDIACLVVSPLLISLVLQRSATVAVLILAAWCLALWLPEVWLLAYAQKQSPLLSGNQLPPKCDSADAELEGGTESHGFLSLDGGEGAAGSPCKGGRLHVLLRNQVHAWALYARQPAAGAAVALALLYLTVCSWNPLMTAYLKSLGLTEARLALHHGLGAVAGLTASLAFPLLCRWAGLVPAGVVGVFLQLACLLAGVLPSVTAALGLASRPGVQVAMLSWGLTLSRLGLWTFDLAVNQRIQETTDPSSLGAVNGLQGSLQSLFQLLAYLAGALLHSMDQFVWLMAGSCAMVGTAAALYTAHAVRTSCGSQGRHRSAPL